MGSSLHLEKKEDHRSGSVKKIHYLSGGNGLAGIYIIADGSAKFYYAYTDYLGSLTTLTNEGGTPVEQHNYDPWGNRRALYWEDKLIKPRENIVDRGYTMHEHWDRFKLINMNGRVYDPQLARFLSPDPLLQSPDNHLNFNRYAYCLNNPLRYTDPSGYQYHRIPDGYSWQWINGGWKPVSTSLLSFTVYGSRHSHILSEEDLYLEFGMMSVGEGPSIVEEFLTPPSLLEMVGKPAGIGGGGKGTTVARVPEKLPVRRPWVVSGGREEKIDNVLLSDGLSSSLTVAVGPVGASIEIGAFNYKGQTYGFTSFGYAIGLDVGGGMNYFKLYGDPKTFNPYELKGNGNALNVSVFYYSHSNQWPFERYPNPYYTKSYKMENHGLTYGPWLGGVSWVTGYTWIRKVGNEPSMTQIYMSQYLGK